MAQTRRRSLREYRERSPRRNSIGLARRGQRIGVDTFVSGGSPSRMAISRGVQVGKLASPSVAGCVGRTGDSRQWKGARHDAGRVASDTEHRLACRPDHCQDAGPNRFRECGPRVNDSRQLGVQNRILWVKCAGFCAALVRNTGFPRVFWGCSNPVHSAPILMVAVRVWDADPCGGRFLFAHRMRPRLHHLRWVKYFLSMIFLHPC
jgi:hypothetical protein